MLGSHPVHVPFTVRLAVVCSRKKHSQFLDLKMQVIAANGLSDRVSVVQKDVALLQRGHEVRYLGCNLAIADLFDAGAPHNFLYSSQVQLGMHAMH